MNPPIPKTPCFACGIPTDETQSIHGVGHMECFKEARVPATIEEKKLSTLTKGEQNETSQEEHRNEI